MRRQILFMVLLAAVAALAACSGGGTANNSGNANSGNSNAAKPVAAAPSKDTLVGLEKKAYEAWKNKDGKYFEGFLADNMIAVDPAGKLLDKAAVVKDIVGRDCDVKSFSFSDEQVTPVDADTAVLTAKTTQDYTCEGKAQPANVWMATVYVRSGDTWKAVSHNEIAIPEKKEDKAAADDKKPGTPPLPAKSAAEEKVDPVAAPYVEAIKKGWDAWKARDAKAFDGIVTGSMVLIDPTGQRFDKAGAIKSWTEPKCDIKGYTLTDAHAANLSKTAGILIVKGTADGSCEGMSLGPLWGTYVLVKEGDAWKAAMIFENPA